MVKKIEQKYFRHKGGLRPSISALLYCQLAYFGGAAFILSLNPIQMIPGTFAMAHGMVIAAYMIHECGHNSLFKCQGHNALLGRALNWLTGGCYGTYEGLRAVHMQHHVDKADVAAFDYKAYLGRHPVQLKIVEALEWLYIPAVEFLMHGALVLAPFFVEGKKEQRPRIIGIMVVRFSLLMALFLYSPIAFACYVLAYTILVTILRFMDALQHNYEFVMTSASGAGSTKRKGDRDYEQSHTFSNVTSTRYPWLNLLTLNFGYHNAHHSRPTAPWHELPKLHEALYGSEANIVVPFGKQLSSFHKNRVARVLGDTSEAQKNRFAQRLQNGSAVGADGVSFLTPV